MKFTNKLLSFSFSIPVYDEGTGEGIKADDYVRIFDATDMNMPLSPILHGVLNEASTEYDFSWKMTVSSPSDKNYKFKSFDSMDNAGTGSGSVEADTRDMVPEETLAPVLVSYANQELIISV